MSDRIMEVIIFVCGAVVLVAIVAIAYLLVTNLVIQ